MGNAGGVRIRTVPEPISLTSFARRLVRHQDPHSLFLLATALFFSFTLVIDLILHRASLDTWVVVVLLCATVGFGIAVLFYGKRFPLWAGLACVATFTAASMYFLSVFGDVQSGVASAQELPILALYLGWFAPRPHGRIILLAVLAILIVIIALNPIFWASGQLGVASASQMILMALLSFEIASMLWRRMQKRITTDQLTKVFNRAGFFNRLERELNRASRTSIPTCIAVIDFDHFKQLNDTLGHHAGDVALQTTVNEWEAALRSGDVVGRTGGDEFAILLHRVDAHEAIRIMERLRENSTHAWTWGIAQVRPGDTPESLFIRADRQLYKAKDRRVDV